MNLYYDKLIRKVEEYGGKNYLMVDDCTLDTVLDRIKRIDIEELDDAKILIEVDDKLPDDTTLQNDVILMTCAIKHCDKFLSTTILRRSTV